VEQFFELVEQFVDVGFIPEGWKSAGLIPEGWKLIAVGRGFATPTGKRKKPADPEGSH
jgi:hypothetical protein